MIDSKLFADALKLRTPLEEDEPLAIQIMEACGGKTFLLDFFNDHLQPKSKAEVYALAYRMRQRLTDRGWTMDAALDAAVARFGHLVTSKATLRAEARKLSGNNPFGKIPNESSPREDSDSPSPPSTDEQES